MKKNATEKSGSVCNQAIYFQLYESFISEMNLKVEKINLRIMSKQYAHLHTMAKTSMKFRNDWPKTVGGVAFTRHLLTIRVLGITD